MGFNGKGEHFIIDEDTGSGKYTTSDKFNQLMYKINELIDDRNNSL